MRTPNNLIESMVVAVGLMSLGSVLGLLLPVEVPPETIERAPEIRSSIPAPKADRHREQLRNTVELLLASLPRDSRSAHIDVAALDQGAE